MLFYKDYLHGHQVLNSYLLLLLEALLLCSIQWNNMYYYCRWFTTTQKKVTLATIAFHKGDAEPLKK